MKVGEGAGGFGTAIVEREALQLMRIACCERCDGWCDMEPMWQMHRTIGIRSTDRKVNRFQLVKRETVFRVETSSLPFCAANSAECPICASDV